VHVCDDAVRGWTKCCAHIFMAASERVGIAARVCTHPSTMHTVEKFGGRGENKKELSNLSTPPLLQLPKANGGEEVEVICPRDEGV